MCSTPIYFCEETKTGRRTRRNCTVQAISGMGLRILGKDTDDSSKLPGTCVLVPTLAPYIV